MLPFTLLACGAASPVPADNRTSTGCASGRQPRSPRLIRYRPSGPVRSVLKTRTCCQKEPHRHPAPGSSTSTSTPEPTVPPTKSAEYLERYESIYAELRAEGKSPEDADVYATAYADRRELGKAHDNATLYAVPARPRGRSEIYATAYADQVEQGKSDQVR